MQGSFKELAHIRELESAQKIKNLYKYQICDILRDFITPFVRSARAWHCDRVTFLIKNSALETLLNPQLAHFEIYENAGKVHFKLSIGKEFIFFNLKETSPNERTCAGFALNTLRTFGKDKGLNVLNLILQNLKAGALEVIMSDYDFIKYHLKFSREGFSSDYTPFYSWIQLRSVRNLDSFISSALCAKTRSARACDQKETLFITN